MLPMLRTRVVWAILLCAAAGVVTSAVPQVAAPDFSRLDGIVRKELAATQAPGAAVAVVADGRMVYARGFGVANVETGEPMRPEMLFRLGSTTKMITAATVLLLAEQGKLSLTEPISRYIPNLHPSIGRLTADQLLSHQSGILDEAPMFGSHDDGAMQMEIESWTEAKFFAEPGEIYSYSNPGYWLAGRLAEAVGGRPFADQVADTIFTPLGMTRSTFRPTLAMTYPLAQGHEIADGKPRIIRPAADNSASWPAGSIYSNVMDLSRWMMALMESGQIGGEQALPSGLFSSLTTPRALIPGGAIRYGYGVQVGESGGARVVQHNGSRSGYGSVMRMFPDQKVGVIVLANRTGASLTQTADAALATALGPRPAQLGEPVNASPLSAAEILDLAGTYSQGGSRQLVVAGSPEGLVLRQGGRDTALQVIGTGMSKMEGTVRRELAVNAGTARYVFVLDESGKVQFLHSGGRSWRKVQ
jgi:CubicO group peptidase (beta-lactamase class C family)